GRSNSAPGAASGRGLERHLFSVMAGHLLYSPNTSPTGVRGHDRHIIIAWNRLSGRPSMPWREVSVMNERREFVRLTMQEGANRRELCRRFGIHPDTGYKWLSRWQADRAVA